jgi:hypothetical protein
MKELNTNEQNIHFEIWGNYYELVLNKDNRYNLYKLQTDNKKKLFNITFDTTNPLKEARQWVINHDTAPKVKEEINTPTENIKSMKFPFWLKIVMAIVLFFCLTLLYLS